MLAYKRKNKLTALLVAISLLLQAALSFTSSAQFLSRIAEQFAPEMTYYNPLEIIQCLFQPMTYAIITICTNGFSGYIDSIFGYGYVINGSATACYIISVAVFMFLFLWALIVFIIIYRQEHMKSCRKLKKAVNLSTKAVAAALTLNLLTMTTFTALAYSDIDNQIAQSQIERRKMIDYVINADLSKGSDTIIKAANDSGFDMQFSNSDNYEDLEDSDKYYLYHSNNNQLSLYAWYDYTEYCFITYNITTYNTGDELALLNQGLYFERKDFINIRNGTTLDEFMNMGFYGKAAIVEKSNSDIVFTFMYNPDSEEYKDGQYTANLQFVDGVLISNDAIDYYYDEIDEYNSNYYDENIGKPINLKDFMDEIMDN